MGKTGVRAWAIVASLCVGLGVSACGGSSEDLGPYTSQQVAKAFSQATGDALASSPGQSVGIYELLRPSGSIESLPGFDRYGVFSIYILKKERARDIVYRRDPDTKKEIKPTADGIYWRSLTSNGRVTRARSRASIRCGARPARASSESRRSSSRAGRDR